MSYNIIAVPKFKSELKKLAKKYSSLKSDLASFFDNLETNPKQGTFLGHNCYKIRLAIASKGKGQIWRRKGYYQFCGDRPYRISTLHL